jgi:glycerate-2-kinase
LPDGVLWIQGGHPEPDERSLAAATAAMEIAAGATHEAGLLLVLVSGGGSAMLSLPASGITLEDKRRTIDALSRSGIPIAGLNCVRKHLSSIKGGWLAAAANGPCLTLAISDVPEPEDDVATIASGPTVPDTTTFLDALQVVDRASVRVPPAVRAHLERGAAGEIDETPKPRDPRLEESRCQVIANRHTALAGAALAAKERGYTVRLIERAVLGEASAAGRAFAESASALVDSGPRCCVIASGETTVTVRGDGRGGRNQEFVLGAARALARQEMRAVVGSAGTDGIDGPTDAAGGIVSSATLDEARARGVDLDLALARNDAYAALSALGGLIRWGPTLTNVGDLHILMSDEA